MDDDVPVHLAEAVATVRAFASASGAERVVLIVDRGEGRPAAMVEGDEQGAVEASEGDERWAIAARSPAGAPPLALPSLRPPPPSAIAFDADSGELEAPIGAVGNLAAAVLALAEAFGRRSVASVDFPTRDPEQPLTIAARSGEPIVVAAGDRRFELPPGVLG
jgi:hypothetical protein